MEYKKLHHSLWRMHKNLHYVTLRPPHYVSLWAMSVQCQLGSTLSNGTSTHSHGIGMEPFMALFHCMVRHGTVRYGSLLGGFPLGTVPGTFLVPPQPRFQASCTVTKTWRVNSTDHWLAGENRHYCINELATRDPPLQPDTLDLNQHSQRRIGRNFCLNKRTFLHQPQNSSVVVCWGGTDVLLVDSRGADPTRAWWRDAEGKSLMYITLLLNLLYFQSMFSVYIFTFVSVFCFN